MKLAASNIAWDPDEDDAVADILRDRGFTGVEIAPSKRWDSPADATPGEIAAYRQAWEDRGLKVVAMQALLFGRPELQLFTSSAVRGALREYLTALIEMAHGLGARSLVFGSPKNRKRGKMPLDAATGIAVEFFREIGEVAASRDCVICIEPNPTVYECDFINTTAEAVALCERIASRGVKVNGDAGAIATNGEDPAAAIATSFEWLGHFHASEPGLTEVGNGEVHRAAAAELKARSWAGWVSIEMRAPENERLTTIGATASRVAKLYG
jgi:D-psicose/D-tagatose/L-ribulose 3-epimerase